MKLKHVLEQAAVMGLYLLSEPRERRQIIFQQEWISPRTNKKERYRVILPVTPRKYKIQTAQSNKVIEILDTGEALLFGNPKLKRLSFESFFPKLEHEYPFAVGDNREPEEFIDIMIKFKEDKAPFQVIITDSPVNMQMVLMNFDYWEQDGTRDIYYSLDLTEYRDLNTPLSNNPQVIDDLTGLRGRKNTAQDSDQQQRFVDNALDIYEKSKTAYGNFDSIDVFKTMNNVSNLSLSGISTSWKW